MIQTVRYTETFIYGVISTHKMCVMYSLEVFIMTSCMCEAFMYDFI